MAMFYKFEYGLNTESLDFLLRVFSIEYSRCFMLECIEQRLCLLPCISSILFTETHYLVRSYYD